MMIKLLKTSKWALTFMSMLALVFIASCGDEGDPAPPPDPIDPPSGLTYAATTVAVGAEGTIPATISGDAANFEITDYGNTKDGADVIVDVTIDSGTGELSVAKESTLGVYTVEVTATNAGGNTTGSAEITIGINPDFDPTGKNLQWKYFMNNTEGVTLVNLDLLDDEAPPSIVLPTGWPAGWDTGAINPADPTFESYFIFTAVQELLMQVPGDDVCGALDPKEGGDTLLVIVNPDLTLSTTCHVDETAGTTVEIGTSTISYANDGFIWSVNTALQGVPITIAIAGAAIQSDYLDPLYPNWAYPSGTGGMYDAITGNVESYMTPTDFDPENYITSLQFINVDVVLQILE